MTTTASPAVLCPETQLTNSVATYITGPANSKIVIKQASFTNGTGGAVTITVHRVVSAGTAGATNIVIPARSIAAGAVDRAPELFNMVLNAGDTIQALASAAASINFTASGFLVS